MERKRPKHGGQPKKPSNARRQIGSDGPKRMKRHALEAEERRRLEEAERLARELEKQRRGKDSMGRTAPSPQFDVSERGDERLSVGTERLARSRTRGVAGLLLGVVVLRRGYAAEIFVVLVGVLVALGVPAALVLYVVARTRGPRTIALGLAALLVGGIIFMQGEILWKGVRHF